ncbi:MAG: 2-phospho-L-lactate transferase [Microbacterium ginsengisoli]|uniref:2-phospho-L-lactate transferase n=2 Tax=Microbacterium TaxID=33882 RepID=A0A0F0LTS8_9MICO|nr:MULTISPECIES: 2-phospho-L-lactate transferase [Microbacterium]KQR91820.1 2-phospho-L-lactate transferase [Microbacterium sp. Leaf351]KJL36533.1 2-phospho-L-lactate transferase [Microbacterium ginsengisoli]KQR91615.1 2-phospho-L-lactate transferase [Microbacterium sp. Leaf347]MBN9197913.1 2-phospho-L-lactate transferase [Microbacterium ginsengisoli]OJU79199.1 MAG: 2-phospho-L-lactate transferase [Microbacterium sp. 71-23]
MTRVVVLAGGVGGSKFTLGVREALARRGDPAATVVVNTGDDLWLSGVRLQPDIDSVLYALGGQNDTVRGWGRAGDTERVNAELQAWGAGWPWFTLGDLDLGTHLARTGWLRDGLSVTEVVARLSARWPLGVTLLPMTDSEADTWVRLESGEVLHFQEWWTRHRATLAPRAFENPGLVGAVPAPGVVEAIAAADVVLLAPSNPVVSIGPILAVPGVRDALAATSARVVGVSPIIGGAVVRGMADVCLTAIGVDTAADAVAAHYGSRTAGGVLDAWLLAEEDAALAPAVAAVGITPVVAPLWMTDVAASAAIADAALAAAAR